MRHRHVRLRVRDPGLRNELEVDLAAELVTRREFWNRIERGDARQLLVAVNKSWKAIGASAGEEAIDITEKLFIDICRFATADADVEARLSHVAFAAYWAGIPNKHFASDVFKRWFPMRIKTQHYDATMEAAWFSLEVSPGETSRDVFDRVAAQVDDDALPRGWDGQVG